MGLLEGVLGDGWADPQSQGMLALAGGLLQGNFGRGVENMNTTMMNAPMRQMEILKLQQALRQGQITNEVYAKALAGMNGMSGGQPYQDNVTNVQPGQAGSGTMDPANPQFSNAPRMAPSPGVFGMNNNQLLGGMLGGPAEFGKAILSANATPDAIRTADILGVSRGDQRSGAQRKLAGEGLVNVRPGGSVLDPMNPTSPLFTAPVNGIQTTWKNGVPTQGVIAGASVASAAMAAAPQAGKNTETIAPPEFQITYPDGTTSAYTIAQVQAMQRNGKIAPIAASSLPTAPTQKTVNTFFSEGRNPAAELKAQYDTVLAEYNDPKTDPADKPALGREVMRLSGQLNGTQGDGQPNPQGFGKPGGQKTGLENAQNELSKKFSELQAANSQAQITTSYLQNIKQQAQKAATGPFSDKADFINGLISTFVPGEQKRATDAVTANDLLDKYSNQIVARLGQGGLGTDAARMIISAAYPNSKMNLQAINEAADNLVGANEMVKAKMALLASHGNARDPIAYQQKEQVFDQNADPRIWQWNSITDPKQRKAFAAMVMKQDPSFPKKITALESIGAIR